MQFCLDILYRINSRHTCRTPQKGKTMNKIIIAVALLSLAGCGKVGVGGSIKQAFGDWAEVKLPDGCKAHQISAEEGNGVAVLCEDGRIFH